MKRRDEGETKPTSNLKGRPKIKVCKVPGCRAKATTYPGLGEKPHARDCRAEATCTTSGLGERCKINRETKRVCLQ